MSDFLQTCPYLTCLAPGDPSPIVYAIDESAPPDVTPPPDAAFGVIDLRRVVSWHPDPRALEVLHHAAPAALERDALAELYGEKTVTDLADRRWLQPPDELCREYFLTTAQVEVTAHCNWGCRFCPVSVDRKPAATMSIELFEEIAEKLALHGGIRYVTFHFYNEPTLDRHFEDRLAVLARHGLVLRLFTNASHLTVEKIEALRRSGVLDRLVVNLPSVQEDVFRSLTQSRTYAMSRQNLEAAIEGGLPVAIAVNGAEADVGTRVDELRQQYSPRGVPVNSTLISDRAGLVEGQYNQAIRIDGRLRGCGWPVNHAHFSVRGEMFVCCNDYYQRETFGNIRSGSVHEILSGPAAVLSRRRIFGVAEAPDDYLCRGCHDQLPDFPRRQFRPLASFPLARPCACESEAHA